MHSRDLEHLVSGAYFYSRNVERSEASWSYIKWQRQERSSLCFQGLEDTKSAECFLWAGMDIGEISWA